MSDTNGAPGVVHDERARSVHIGFLNFAHALDHYVMLIFPTVVIGLAVIYQRSYADLLFLATASFFAFGIFSLPAGWLADHWSRRNMMAVFWFGCGSSLAAGGMAPNVYVLAAALAVLGMFASIYHPVGMAMLIEASKARGRTLAFNGVCGNLGAALAAGITALIASYFGWRAAFFVPAALCLITGAFYLALMPDDRHQTAKRESAPQARPGRVAAVLMFGLFIVIALCAGLVFNVISVALPKIVDERINNVSLVVVGGLTTTVFIAGAMAQLAIGRLVERFAPHMLLMAITAILFAGVIWSAYASGPLLMAALMVAMIGIYGQVTVNDVVIARYTADAWRGRVYAVRYFLVFISSGAAVAIIAFLHSRGGFDLVLLVTAAISLAFFVATLGVAVIASGAETGRRAAVPAE